MLSRTAPSAEDQLDRQIARMAAGEREALAELYAQTRPAIYALALSIVRNGEDAEDVMQDAYVQVWQNAGRYRAQGTPMAWLLAVTRNLALDCRRRRSRIEPLETETLFQAPAVTQEDRVLLSALLEELEEEARQIVVLHALGGLRHRETAAMLGLPLGTVLTKYNRAIKRLRLAGKEAGLDA